MRFIKKRKEYLSIYSKKNRLETKLFLAFYSLSENFSVGIAVTKKVGNAVVRNKVKRRIKSYLHSVCNFDNNLSLVIIAKPIASDIPWYEFKNNLDQIFLKLEKI